MDVLKLLWRMVVRQVHVLIVLSMPLWMVLMLLVGVHLLTSTHHFRDGLVGYLNDLFAGQWEVQEIRWASDPRFMDIYGVTLKTPKGEESARLRELHVKLDLAAMLQGQIAIAGIDVAGLKGELVFDDRGGFNITKIFTTAPKQMDPPRLEEEEDTRSDSSFVLSVDEVNVREADVDVVFPDFGFTFRDVEIDHFSLSITNELIMEASAMRVPRAHVRFEPQLFSQPPMSEPDSPGELSMDVTGLEVENWTWFGEGFGADSMVFEGGGASYALKDGLMKFSRTSPGFEYRAVVDIELPPDYPALPYFVRGVGVDAPMHFTMDAEGFLGLEMNGRSVIDVKLVIDLKYFQILGLKTGEGTASLRLINRRLYLETLDIGFYGGKVSLAPPVSGPLPLSISGLKAPPVLEERAYLSLLDLSYRMALLLENVQVGELLRDMDAPPTEEALKEIDGTLTGTLNAEGRLTQVPDVERGQAMPGYHRVRMEQVNMRRTNPGRRVPAERISLTGGFLWKEGRLKGEEPLEVRLDQDTVRFNDLELDTTDGELPVKARVELNVERLERYLGPFGVKDISGGVRARLNLNNKIMRPRIRGGQLRLSSPQVMGLRSRDMNVGFGLEDGWLSVSGVGPEGEFGSAEARGRIKLFDETIDRFLKNPTLDFHVSSATGNLGPLLRDLGLSLPLQGKVQLSQTRITGVARSPRITGVASAQELDAFGERIRRLRSRFEVTPTQIKLRDLDLYHGQRGVLRGRVDYGIKSGFIDTELRLQGLALEELNGTQAAELQGEVRHLVLNARGALALASLQGTGPLEGGARKLTPGDIIRWTTVQKLDLSGALALTELKVGARKLGSVVMNLQTLTQRDPARQSEICPGEKTLYLDAVWLPEVPQKARLTLIEAANMQALDPLLTEGASPFGWGGVRKAFPAYLNVDACVPMSDPNEDIYLRASFDNFNVRGLVAGFLQRDIKIQRQAMALANKRESTAVGVVYRIRQQRAVAAGQDPEKVRRDLRPVRELTPLTALEETLRVWNSAELGGEVIVSLDRSRDSGFQAELILHSLDAKILGRRLINKDTIEVTVAGRDFQWERLSLGDNVILGVGNREVQLKGTVLPDVVELEIDGGVDMGLLNFFPTIMTNMQGGLRAHLELKGPWSKPDIQGDLEVLDRITFRLRSLKQNVEINRGKIRIGENKVQVSNLDLDMLEGRATLNGSLSLGDDYVPGQIGLKLHSENMTYRLPGSMYVTFNSDMEARIGMSRPETWTVGGEVYLVEGKFYQDIEVLSGLAGQTFAGLAGGGRTEEFQSSFLDNTPWVQKVGLDVKLEGRDGFFIESEIQTVRVQAELKTELEIQGSLEKLSVVGEVRVLPGGKIVYKGEDFSIREGELGWTGELKNPNLRFVGEADIESSCGGLDNDPGNNISDVGATDVQTYHILMNVEGPLKELEELRLDFTSTPVLDRRDVLSMIVTGCTLDQLTSSAAGRPALALALQPFFNQLEKQIGSYIPVDEIRLGGDIDNTSIGLSKKVSERLVLGFDAAIGDSTSQHQLGATYLILDNFFFELSERRDASGVFTGQGKFKLRIPLD